MSATNSENNFLATKPEDGDLNQYWYSAKTISAIVAEIEASGAKRVAFLSTPSIFFSLTNPDIKANSVLFDVSFKSYFFKKKMRINITLSLFLHMQIFDTSL